MPILRSHEADSELDKVCAIKDFDVGAHEYPLVRLSADDFERFNYALFKISAPQALPKDGTTLQLCCAERTPDAMLFSTIKASL